MKSIFFHNYSWLPVLLIAGILISFPAMGQQQKTTISIEKSPYGMLFTNIIINGIPVKAIIDFGDPNRFQLSDVFVKQSEIPVKITNKMAMDILGNKYPVSDGIIDSVRIGEWTLINEPFSSSPNEIKLVSQQINTEFHAVIGWGFFSDYYITMNYMNNEIMLSSIGETHDNASFSSNLNSQSSYLVLQSNINGINANLILDTGSPLTLLDSTFFSNNNIPSSDTITKHLEDSIPLKIIKTTFRNSAVNIPYLIYELTALNLLAVGVIGGDILNKYKVYIEPKEKLIHFIDQ